ncbi:MAG: sigma-54-dependent Fis family transcriptional regulator [Desulfosarcina sp.]|nr:sigma-54-dependent Fis family transcriptional regulator [Desulfobacterales bacterium]
MARAIHESSPKSQGKFLAFNCASFTDDLLANELFGHEKEAFTGAIRSHSGLFESADGGTVFLDEVGDMSSAMQVKLLRVIQEREVIRLGGTKSIPINVRIIAATNKNLKQLCSKGYFRQDLYFRLKVISIRMPNLSERRTDIPLLASHFLRLYASRAKKDILEFSDEALGLLTSYEYPGNIRELENIVEHAVSMPNGRMITIENLPADLVDYDFFTFHGQDEKFKTLAELEKEYIRWVLDHVEHKKSEAAKILGINRVSLYRKLKRFEFED